MSWDKIDWRKYPNFTEVEFRCKCGCGQNEIKENFLDLLQRMRTDLGFGLSINSGYRCPNHNNSVSKTGLEGPHTTGLAADINATSEQMFLILAWAINHGVKRFGIAKSFIHLDISDKHPTPRIWSY